ncbi:hypothetical protein FHG64_06500 [Antarcticibacterium flavum]|uniref:Uncharacterized protein n=1 Tax=Antarcticibacterium flavum TaxID=2058175 RepID=A0A5B7X1V5_9FLAO|nr:MULTISPECIES: hypothetical protein [Antarcticibacterium]MCM4161301.1 hypothetical protein [Antarcticibacterium sp. W02-3]QCY69085.1 hypothetical protein FHG64_06500 [Antarcticibacterium flavum]
MIYNTVNQTANNQRANLTEQLAENLLCLGFSISFEEMNGIEFISVTSEASPGGKLFFLPFDPVTNRAADFLLLLSLMSGLPGTTSIVVAGAGEREMMRNILRMQEISGIEVWSLDKLKDYPLQVI